MRLKISVSILFLVFSSILHCCISVPLAILCRPRHLTVSQWITNTSWTSSFLSPTRNSQGANIASLSNAGRTLSAHARQEVAGRWRHHIGSRLSFHENSTKSFTRSVYCLCDTDRNIVRPPAVTRNESISMLLPETLHRANSVTSLEPSAVSPNLIYYLYYLFAFRHMRAIRSYQWFVWLGFGLKINVSSLNTQSFLI